MPLAAAWAVSIDDKLWALIHLFIRSECHLNEYFADDSDSRSQIQLGQLGLTWSERVA